LSTETPGSEDRHASGGESEATASAESGAARYALVLLTIAYALNFIDRQILVILQGPIKAEMGLSDTQLGLLSGFSFALVYITAGIPIAYWADRGNRKNIIALAIAVWSGMTALSGLATNYFQLLLARIGVGIGEAGGSPPAHAIISDYYPPERRATAMSIYSAGLHLGVFAGFVIGGTVEQFFGWRMAFMVVGIPGLVFAAIFFLTVREPQRGRFESTQAAAYQPSLGETLTLLRRYRSFWYIAMGTGLTAFAGYGNGNFTPLFLERSHGITGAELGLILALGGGGGGLVGTLLGGRLSDGLASRDYRWYMWLPAVCGALAMVVAIPYLLLDTTWVVVPLVFVVSVLINTYLGPCLAICHALVPPAMRALTSAVLFFILNLIGLGMGPLVAGFLSDVLSEQYGDDGLRYAMLIVAGISSIGIAMFVLAARNLKRDYAIRDALTNR
jgi:predicted MFS family arabinose efflux permease